MNLQTPIHDMKANGDWPLPWTSAIGLVEVLNKIDHPIVGCEIGVSYGFNLVYFLDNIPNITTVYAIDPYIPYDDGPGGYVSQETIDKVKELFLINISPYNKVKFINLTSDEAHFNIAPESLDYIFIDGDHSFNMVYRDMYNYYDKVRVGGVFSGHDFHLSDVNRAVHKFREKHSITSEIKTCANSVWYWIKND